MIERCHRIDFWTNVGKPYRHGFPRVRSWEEALDVERKFNWSNVKLRAANDIRNVLRTTSRDEYRRWNAIVDLARPKVEAIADPAAKVIDEEELQTRLRDMVRWDLLHALVEHEYRTLGVAFFYRNLVEVYEAGHFPCSWEGEFPDGRLVVY